MKASLLLIGLLSAGVALAAPPAPKTQGIEGKDYREFKLEVQHRLTG